MINEAVNKFSIKDPMPTWLLKSCIDLLAPYIMSLFNSVCLSMLAPSLSLYCCLCPYCCLFTYIYSSLCICKRLCSSTRCYVLRHCALAVGGLITTATNPAWSNLRLNRPGDVQRSPVSQRTQTTLYVLSNSK